MFHFRFSMQKAASCRLFAFCAAVFLAAILNAFGDVLAYEASVRFVPDGDTFFTTDGESVRLAGIDAPETGKDGAPSQYYAKEAAERLRQLVLGKSVEISKISTDRYGRVVAEVSLPDGRSLQEIMVREGLTFVYPHADGQPERQQRLLLVQREAMEAGRGFWPKVLLAPQNSLKWGGNEKSLRFGPQNGCKPLKMTSRGRRIAFMRIREAFWEGYAPYRECRSPFDLQN